MVYLLLKIQFVLVHKFS